MTHHIALQVVYLSLGAANMFCSVRFWPVQCRYQLWCQTVGGALADGEI